MPNTLQILLFVIIRTAMLEEANALLRQSSLSRNYNQESKNVKYFRNLSAKSTQVVTNLKWGNNNKLERINPKKLSGFSHLTEPVGSDISCYSAKTPYTHNI
jgi:hypothetical protein